MTLLRPSAVAALLSVLVLASCSSVSPAGSPSTQPSSTASTSDSAPTASINSRSATAAPPDPTCENIVTPGTVDALKSAGWTAQQQELRIGDVVVDGGLLCLWSDFDVPSDHGQMYGWGPIDDKTARTAMTALKRDGWLKSTKGGAVYFTEDPDYALETDADGFGMTYEFGEGWVRFADTKQGLLLIEGVR